MSGIWFGGEKENMITRLEALMKDLRKIHQGVVPLVGPSDVMIDDYLLFQRAVPCLAGRMFNHPDIEDERPAVSSELYYLD